MYVDSSQIAGFRRLAFIGFTPGDIVLSKCYQSSTAIDCASAASDITLCKLLSMEIQIFKFVANLTFKKLTSSA